MFRNFQMFVGKLTYRNKIFTNISIKLYISLHNFILVIRKNIYIMYKSLHYLFNNYLLNIKFKHRIKCLFLDIKQKKMFSHLVQHLLHQSFTWKVSARCCTLPALWFAKQHTSCPSQKKLANFSCPSVKKCPQQHHAFFQLWEETVV